MTDLIPTDPSNNDEPTEIKEQSAKTLDEPTDSKEKLWEALDKAIEELVTEKITLDQGRECRPDNISAARKFLPIMKAQLSAFPVPRATTEYDGAVELEWFNKELLSLVRCTFQVDIENEEIEVCTCGRGKVMIHRLLSFSSDNHDEEQAIIAVLQQFLKEVFP